MNTALTQALKNFCMAMILFAGVLGYFCFNVIGTEVSDLKSPHIQKAAYAKGSISFQWEPVEFATSYQVYRKDGQGKYVMIRVLPHPKVKFSESRKTATGVDYAVRAVRNVKGKTVRSDVSKPLSVGEGGKVHVQ